MGFYDNWRYPQYDISMDEIHDMEKDIESREDEPEEEEENDE